MAREPREGGRRRDSDRDRDADDGLTDKLVTINRVA
jgi:small subunit ribosomal protein S5